MFHGRSITGRPVLVSFEWFGSADHLPSARSHWHELISLSADVGTQDWLQPIVQAVDLEDCCAIAVAPSTDVLTHLVESDDCASVLVDLAIRVARTLLIIEQSQMRLLRLEACDVVVDESGDLRIAPHSELVQASKRRRTEYVTSNQLFVQWLDDISRTLPRLSAQCAVLRGVESAMAAHDSGAQEIGNLILALEALRSPNLRQHAPTETQSRAPWRKPEPKKSHRTRYAGATVIALLCVGLSVGKFLPGMGVSDAAEGISAPPHGGSVVTSESDSEPDAQSQDDLAEVEKSSRNLIVQRLRLLEMKPEDLTADDLEKVYVAGSSALTNEQDTSSALAQAGVTVSSVELRRLELTQEPELIEGGAKVRVAYEFTYLIDGVKKSESEEIDVLLQRVGTDYRIAGVETAPPAP